LHFKGVEDIADMEYDNQGNITGRTDPQNQQKPVRKNGLLFYELYKEVSWLLSSSDAMPIYECMRIS